MQSFFKKLLNWRKGATAIHNGKLVHFVPVDGVYTYFRYNDSMKVMVMLNKTDNRQVVKLRRFAEVLEKETKARDIFSGKELLLKDNITVDAKEALILEITNGR